MTPAPAPAPTRWPDPRWVQAQFTVEWVRQYVPGQQLDPTDLRATMGRQAPRIMREAMEEGR